jgi:hypothetical protein
MIVKKKEYRMRFPVFEFCYGSFMLCLALRLIMKCETLFGYQVFTIYVCFGKPTSLFTFLKKFEELLK